MQLIWGNRFQHFLSISQYTTEINNCLSAQIMLHLCFNISYRHLLKIQFLPIKKLRCLMFLNVDIKKKIKKLISSSSYMSYRPNTRIVCTVQEYFYKTNWLEISAHILVPSAAMFGSCFGLFIVKSWELSLKCGGFKTKAMFKGPAAKHRFL